MEQVRPQNTYETHETQENENLETLNQAPSENQNENLQQMLMLLQMQQMLNNSGQTNQETAQPDLNSLVASQDPGSMPQQMQSMPDSTPEDVKVATQKQLADL